MASFNCFHVERNLTENGKIGENGQGGKKFEGKLENWQKWENWQIFGRRTSTL